MRGGGREASERGAGDEKEKDRVSRAALGFVAAAFSVFKTSFVSWHWSAALQHIDFRTVP